MTSPLPGRRRRTVARAQAASFQLVLCMAALACEGPSEPQRAPVVAEVRFAFDRVGLYGGEVGRFVAAAYDAEGVPIDTPIAYSVSDATVLGVDVAGTFIARAQGTVDVDASVGDVSATIPVRVTRFAEIGAFFDPLCAIDVAGDLHCLGTEHRSDEIPPHPTYETWQVIGRDTDLSSLTAGRWHTCGRASARIFCWGANTRGQLGMDIPTWVAEPTQTHDAPFEAIDAGWEHTCAIDVTGGGYCWGHGLNGQLGQGELASSAVPVPIYGGHTWRSIDAGYFNTCGLAEDGQTYCWGDHFGWGHTGYTIPAPIEDLPTDMRLVRAGDEGACASKAAAVYCWAMPGRYYPMPPDVTMPATVVDLALAESSACALLVNGQIHCWGHSPYGLLGIGTTTTTSVPMRVAGDQTFVGLSGFERFHCGLTEEGAVYCWGGSDLNGIIAASNVPARVPAPKP